MGWLWRLFLWVSKEFSQEKQALNADPVSFTQVWHETYSQGRKGRKKLLASPRIDAEKESQLNSRLHSPPPFPRKSHPYTEL